MQNSELSRCDDCSSPLWARFVLGHRRRGLEPMCREWFHQLRNYGTIENVRYFLAVKEQGGTKPSWRDRFRQ